MFRFAKGIQRLSPQLRRAALVTGSAVAGVAASTTVVAFAAGPYKVQDSDVAVSVPSLSPRDLTEPTSYDQAKAESESANPDQASADGSGEHRQAYNPETGEIDWDCPCLGGMAHGPCGEEFKEAFSCFVYSKSEIRGSECIPKFSAMQDCFRKYPEVYAEFNEDTETVAETERAKKQNDVAAAEHEVKEDAKAVKHDSAELANSTQQAVKDAVNDVKDTVTGTVDLAQQKVSETLGDDPRKTVQETAESAVQGASQALSNVAAATSKLTSEYSDKLRAAGTQTPEALSKYSEDVKAAAQQVTDEAKAAAQNLDAHQIEHLIEEKLNKAHDIAQDAFKNTEKNQSAFRQTQQFATGAVAGIAAEAKEAVNYVSDQISKK